MDTQARERMLTKLNAAHAAQDAREVARLTRILFRPHVTRPVVVSQVETLMRPVKTSRFVTHG